MIIKLIIILLVLILVFVLLESARENRGLRITKYYIESEKISSGLKIAVISDLHNRLCGKNNRVLIDAVAKISPDLVLVAGDTINNEKPMVSDNAQNLLIALSREYKVFCVNGNHEQFLKSKPDGNAYFQEYKKNLENHGISYLENGMFTWNDEVDIYGFETAVEVYRRFSYGNKIGDSYVSDRLGAPDRSKYNILLSHTPVYFDSYADWGADLTVSGHLHGGLIRLPFLGGVISPQCVLFPKYDAGLYQKNGSNMAVSRGTGSHTLNIRVCNHPEVLELEIKNKRG
ncbi:metallophosphoesterase [Parasporobacterium paucivorans]|uniref:Calcineurin-like phosphoesterase domain-containing protein n=1 Tax=Parasporobacterium paucivorans DSM 15970 TaxID=1122934 RepID=A0A1M6F7S0_9FIRM|nr:metallophosphoesterase [Parasporobacterium paucivorans]SHI93629.1 hypothetical protein SAMN02745691_01069 [Parasporobacterium paucivorans DSM 15970]